MVHHLKDVLKPASTDWADKDIEDVLKSKYVKDGVIVADRGSSDVVAADEEFKEKQAYKQKVEKLRVDPKVMKVARTLATTHYSKTYEGKVANSITGEEHPPVEASKAHKNPISYMKTHMGIEDPVAHIEKNHVDELRPPAEQVVQMAKAKPAKPFASRTEAFMKEYAKNPLAAFGAEQKPAETEKTEFPMYKPSRRTAARGESFTAGARNPSKKTTLSRLRDSKPSELGKE
jgi:hypothetical protein